MEITAEIRHGEHKGTKFSIQNGLLYIDGFCFTKGKIKEIIEIVTLLEASGLQVANGLKKVKKEGIFGEYEAIIPDEYQED